MPEISLDEGSVVTRGFRRVRLALSIAAAALATLAFRGPYWVLTLALGWGILCDLEGLTMSVLLPRWTRDVKTLRRAWGLRRKMIADGSGGSSDAR